MDWQELFPLIANTTPEDFLQFCYEKKITSIQDIFSVASETIIEEFLNSFKKINGVTATLPGKLLMISLDGDALLATASKTFILPSNSQLQDIEVYEEPFDIFLQSYFSGGKNSKYLPTISLQKSPITDYTYKTVVPAEKALVEKILREKALKLQQQGSTQWQDILTGNMRHDLTPAIEKGEVYFLLTPEKEIFGMLALWQQPTEWDKTLWLDSQNNKSCLYLHRLIVCNAYNGQNLGKMALQLAEKIARNRKFYCIRLDCSAENQKLRQFYQESGYTLANIDNKSGFAMYQKFFR